MKLFSGMMGAVVLFGGVGVAQAQTAQSKVNVALTVQFTQDAAGDSDDTKIAKFRFGTKELIAFVDNAVTGNAIKSVVHRRTPTAADGLPADESYLAEPLLFLDADGGLVTETDAVVQAAIDLTTVTGEVTTLVGAAQVKEPDNTVASDQVSRKDVFVNAAAWTLDANDDDTATTDQIQFDLIGLVTANSKRKTIATNTTGLLFSNWSAPVNGGAHIDDLQTDLVTGDLNGLVTGKISASSEKILVP